MQIERPYALVMPSGQYPAVTTLPDLSQWCFNRMLGLGDKEHNRRVREEREKKRPVHPSESIKLWGIWNLYNGRDDEMERYLEDLSSERIDRL